MLNPSVKIQPQTHNSQAKINVLPQNTIAIFGVEACGETMLLDHNHTSNDTISVSRGSLIVAYHCSARYYQVITITVMFEGSFTL